MLHENKLNRVDGVTFDKKQINNQPIVGRSTGFFAQGKKDSSKRS